MAAFEVPIAPGLFTGIPHDIATAPGAMLPGQAIGNLADAYWSGQNQAYQQRLRDLFKEGVPGNLGDIATQLAQAKGAEAIPEYIALRNRQAADIEAARPLPDVGTGPYSGYVPGPQANAPAEPAPSPTAGTATARQIAQAREVPLEQFMAQNRITNPDIPLTYEQRKALVYGTPATDEEPVRVAGAGATTTVPSAAQTIANRFPSTTAPLGKPFPPSVGASNPAQPQPTAPAQAAQAPAQAQAAPPYQAPSDPQALLLERTANAYAQRAAAARQKQLNLGRDGDAVGAKAAGEDAAANEARANDIYQNLLKRSTPTTEQQNAAASGMTPLQLKAAEYEQNDQLKHLGELTKAGVEASGKIRQLDEVQRLGAKVGYGIVPKIQSFLGAHGIETTGLTDVQAYERAIDYMAPQLRPAGSGRLMEKELTAFRGALGGLMQTPEGRRISIENLKLIQEFSREVGGIASDARLSPAERYKQIYDLKPPKLRIEVTKQSPGSAAQGGGGSNTWTGPTGAVYRVENGQIVGRVK